MLRPFLAPRATAILALALLPLGCQSPSINTPVSLTTPAPASPVTKQAQLATALKGADRVEITRIDASALPNPPLVVRSPEVGRTFLAEIQINELAGDFRCACGSGQSVRFYRGEQLVADLTVHMGRSLGWVNGPWAGSALITRWDQGAFGKWFRRIGGTSAQLSRPGLPSDYFQRQKENAREFAACFPPAVQGLVEGKGSGERQGITPWIETSDLAALVPDRPALAAASFRALGLVDSRWVVDDYRIGIAQTAVAAFSPEDFLAALRACGTDDGALRGAARIYFRMAVHQRLSAEANGEWLPRLADAVLRTGHPLDRPSVLIYVAAAKNPAGWQFLREIATGARRYEWPEACDPRRFTPHEPSAIASAAVLLALSGDRQAPRLARTAKRPVLGLDLAAQEIAESLIDPSRPLRAAHLLIYSHILTYAAAEAASRQPAESIPASVIGAAYMSNDYSFGRGLLQRLFALAPDVGVQEYAEPSEASMYDVPFDQTLAANDPAQAIRLATEHLPDTKGAKRTVLLLVRGYCHQSRNELAEAIADYTAALDSKDRFDRTKIRNRLAFLLFRENRLSDARVQIDLAMGEKPDADLFAMLGVLHYWAGSFGPEADLAFTTAMGLQPTHGYAEIFQHLCAHLSGRPALSHLSSRSPDANPSSGPIAVAIGAGLTLNINGSSKTIAPWPAAIISFFKGQIDPPALLAAANQAFPEEQVTQTCEAHFYISQKARLAHDTDKERESLQKCVAIEAPQVAEYHLAVQRLQQLK